MCRPEKPISTGNKALREFQEWLREHKARTGQDYRALAVRAGCHATTLQRAASGETTPPLQTVLNYARACDASPDEAKRLWKAARYEETRMARGGRGAPAPRPEFVRDFVDLSAGLQDLYEKAGSPPLRAMEQRAGKYGLLPRSTAHRIATKQAVPRSLPQFQAYLRACEVPEADWPVWESAWTRAWRHEKQEEDGCFPIPIEPREGRSPRSLGFSADPTKISIAVPARDVDVLEGLVSAGRARRSGSRRVRRGEVRHALDLLDTLETLVVQRALVDRADGVRQSPDLKVRIVSTTAG